MRTRRNGERRKKTIFYGHTDGSLPGRRKNGTRRRAGRDTFYRILPQKREHTQIPDPPRACNRDPFPIESNNARPTYWTVQSELK